ncbi:thiamin-binding pyruvate dehydrogenase, decarboxylase component E1 [Wigglesworthia glossinidia endosymbiont of Glossina morsitans morsitans (Yale colony)]|uniref:Pyruvate dehydrogenase E1 component n=1 Tax=Wigglesworthia glossinidia endosymbiont of Glossina morsitans morsitans (Yale colony) TaxID=1142511 RepID=H6Q4Z4_WIGGL|nr:pyruvate dehydrogenase (acetyl-transferring), homodimeric type [Wigglesworthia glossinidia]AFA41277.1 thiamin-binding pyruvate dehydrogenase, decarboxylase component E1 [Wigglesworthia glossinidia endosymbiont of Glossina morsitans morsitans (Yale colony)]
MSKHSYYDIDISETHEWIESIQAVIKSDGILRAQYLIDKISQEAKKNCNDQIMYNQNYVNSISVEEEPLYPGDLQLERRIRSVIRWNAVMMVLKASQKNLELGGHISSFQSAATIYEVCFNHFFRGPESNDGGDLVYFQGHISPGIYARAFLEGRLTKEHLDNFRQETNGCGLSSYPHPKLMPNFWQFPTVSMGLGAISGIYQAKFLKYLHHRKIKNTEKKVVYVFLGDGEMDEPESKGAINIAAREKLDNLIFIVNCNLQRLDGPVYGNGKVINELTDFFQGSGWEVIRVIWGSKWDSLLKRDTSGKLIQLMNETVDGDYQNLKSKNGAYIRKNFFGKFPETQQLVQDMTDDEIWNLNRGGHDPKKIYAAFKKAKNIQNKPVIILTHTVKGYGMGDLAEGKNIAHQIKKMNETSIKNFRNRFDLYDIKDDQLSIMPYISLKKKSQEYEYLHNCRKKLFGYLPKRTHTYASINHVPLLEDFSSLLKEQKKNISTTIGFVRILNILLNNQSIAKYLVPIIADEARTFGMEGLFRQIGIYNQHGQKYIPQDQEQLAYYKEEKKGQILQEGINELGATASWIAAATSYSTNKITMIPFYIYYSIFGFQRVGDLIWSASDQGARGFLIGATSGRTTLNGEGLQHADGHSHIQSLVIPNCISYNPTYVYELAVIIQNGLQRMYGINPENIFYYITTLNENYYMPSIPSGVEEGICRGIYKLESFYSGSKKVQLIGSGAILREVRKAAQILYEKYSISVDVYSATSLTEIARNGQDCMRWNTLHPTKEPRIPYISQIMNAAPVVASTDYIKLFAEQIRNFIPSNIFKVLGTDGFGCSDSRENLRKHFEINSGYIVVNALSALYEAHSITSEIVVQAIKTFNIDVDKINPRLV